MKGSFILLLIFIKNGYPYLKQPRPDEGAELEDRDLKALDILQKYGYPAENHTVTTEDGYILTIHRVPYGRMCPQNETKGAILVQHGFFCSSMEFITPGTKRGLAYVLADSCYDVWMPNHRGNTYSKAHVSLDVKSPAYWNFSWHELGIYDLPASIDYILNYTNRKDLIYLGHSQGGTVYLVLASTRPEYNHKIRVGFQLGPVAFMRYTRSELLKIMMRFDVMFSRAFQELKIYDFMPHSRFITKAGSVVCRKYNIVNPHLCENALFLLFGYDSEGFNNTLLPIILGHTPAGASMKQALHYSQCRIKGTFAHFDYGSKKNKEVYNQKKPPNYDLSKIKIPTIIYYSKNDWLATPRDIDLLYKRLKYKKKKILVPNKKFNHCDFVYSKDVVSLVYDSLVEHIDKYS